MPMAVNILANGKRGTAGYGQHIFADAVNIMGNGCLMAIWARVAYFQNGNRYVGYFGILTICPVMPLCILPMGINMSGHGTRMQKWPRIVDYANGDRYVGDFADGQINGQGLCALPMAIILLAVSRMGNATGLGLSPMLRVIAMLACSKMANGMGMAR